MSNNRGKATRVSLLLHSSRCCWRLGSIASVRFLFRFENPACIMMLDLHINKNIFVVKKYQNSNSDKV